MSRSRYTLVYMIVLLGLVGLVVYWIINGFQIAGKEWAGVEQPKPQGLFSEGSEARTVLSEVTAADDAVTRQALEEVTFKQKQDAALARVARDEMRLKAEAVQTQVRELEDLITWWRNTFLPLFTNDKGRAIAANDTHVRTVNSVRSIILIEHVEVQLKSIKNALKAITDPLDLADKSASTYRPDKEVETKLIELANQVGTACAPVREAQSVVESVLRNSSAQTPAGTPTLEVRLALLKQLDDERIATSLAKIELEERQKAESVLVNARVQMIRQEAENQAKIVDAEREAARIRTETAAAGIVKKASQEQAQAHLKLAQESAARQAAAEREQLIVRAKSAEVQRALAPLFAKDTWQPGDRRREDRKAQPPQPVSLEALIRVGALHDSQGGVDAFVRYLTYSHNYRPKWTRPETPDEWETMRQRQKLVRELGPALVELGMMAK